MRYPIGVQTFEEMINGKYVYVDKADLVYDLADRHICFLSRPRRFGKSLLISTLYAYFSGKKELFKGLKIDELEKECEYTILKQIIIWRMSHGIKNITRCVKCSRKA